MTAARHLEVVREPDPFLSVKEIAATLRVSRNTVYRLLEGPRPAIPFTRVGRAVRIRKSAVTAYLNSQANRRQA